MQPDKLKNVTSVKKYGRIVVLTPYSVVRLTRIPVTDVARVQISLRGLASYDVRYHAGLDFWSY